jgi:hypothetical protein
LSTPSAESEATWLWVAKDLPPLEGPADDGGEAGKSALKTKASATPEEDDEEAIYPALLSRLGGNLTIDFPLDFPCVESGHDS